jgi:hypothetical protein
LGGINRARKVVYETISQLRHKLNAAPHSEPDPNFMPESPFPHPGSPSARSRHESPGDVSGQPGSSGDGG